MSSQAEAIRPVELVGDHPLVGVRVAVRNHMDKTGVYVISPRTNSRLLQGVIVQAGISQAVGVVRVGYPGWYFDGCPRYGQALIRDLQAPSDEVIDVVRFRLGGRA